MHKKKGEGEAGTELCLLLAFPAMVGQQFNYYTAKKATGGRSSIPGSPSPSVFFGDIIFMQVKFKGREWESLGKRLEGTETRSQCAM